MNKINFYVLFLLLSLSLEANYCIQVSTANESDRNTIINKARSEQYNKFNAVRVESRGRYLVFRIGDYLNYNDAQEDIYKLREINKEAYIRKCDFLKEKALYVKDDFDKDEETPSYYNNEPEPIHKVVEPPRSSRPQVKEVYKKKKELTYTKVTNSDALWGDCKKCFVPVYEDDSEDDSPELPPKKYLENKPAKPKNVVVHIKEKTPPKDTFWRDETTKQESAPIKIQKPKPKNKFNIDEKFLP